MLILCSHVFESRHMWKLTVYCVSNSENSLFMNYFKRLVWN